MNTPTPNPSAEALAAGYKPSHRVAEYIALTSTAALIATLAWHVRGALSTRPATLAAGMLFGYILADFISGFVHWFCDTWGTHEWPVVGPLFIRTFREHHVDPDSITRHDFVETNGANCMGVMPVLLPSALLFTVDAHSPLRVAFAGFAMMFSLCIPLTSQAHKWAHVKPENVPSVVRALQRMGLLLSAEHHARHHVVPYVKNYCITTGLCDGLLTRIRFFPRLERLITAVTGAQPRDHDASLFAQLADAPSVPTKDLLA